MRVRDALEADAGTLAGMTHAPTRVMRNVIHDRTVRVAERTDEGERDGSADDVAYDGAGEATYDDADVEDAGVVESQADDADGARIVGFVGFDAERDCVYVTHLGGEPGTLSRLLDEPIRFARKSGLPVEMVVPESEAKLLEAVESFGFERAGVGPRFEGTATRRYLLDADVT